MKYAIVLEQDPKFQTAIREALQKVDPELALKPFSKLDDLAHWVNDLIQKDLKEIFGEDGAPQIVLVILPKEQLGTHYISLFKKLKPLLMKKKLYPEDQPPGFILTAFEEPDFDTTKFEDKTFSNVIFKPFDALILEQLLRFAIPDDPKKKLDDSGEVYHMQTKVSVEMLKDVELESFCEIGFVTKSYLPIDIGKISKYYDELFKIENRQSVFAQCVNCTKIPNEEAYQVYFQYVAVDTPVINSLRKLLDKKTDPLDKENIQVTYAAKKKSPTVVQMWIMDDELRERLSGALKEILPAINIAEFKKEEIKNLKSFAETDLVVTDPSGLNSALKVANINQILIVGLEQMTDEFLRSAHGVKDILWLRADRKFLKQKLEFIFKLNPQMSWDVKKLKKIIKVANLVDVSDVSEASVVLTYYRSISLGAFRRFLLTMEKDPPIAFTAICRKHTEKEKDKFEHHFVFFGTTDAYLKRLRLWMRKTYIEENQGES